MNDLHELAIRLAPELAGSLQLMRHQPSWPEPYEAEAYAFRGRVIHVRDYLRSIGEWRGEWGNMIVFVTEPTIGNLLHELGHLLPAEPPILDDRPELPGKSEVQRILHARPTVKQLSGRPIDCLGSSTIRNGFAPCCTCIGEPSRLAYR